MRLFQELNKGQHARIHLCRGPGMGWGGDGVLNLGRKLDPRSWSPDQRSVFKVCQFNF